MKKLVILTLCIFVNSFCSSAQVNLLDSLKLYLPFTNGNTSDANGESFVVIVNGPTPTQDRFGNAGGAYHFPAAYSYIAYGDIFDEYTTGPNKQFTISLWMKPGRNQMTNTYLIVKRNASECSADQRQFMLRVEDNTINFTYENELTWVAPRNIDGQIPVNDTSKWHHVLITYDGTTNGNNGLDRVNIYVNCVHDSATLDPVSQGTLSYMKNSTSQLGLGNNVMSNGLACNTSDDSLSYLGDLDDIRFYNRILNQAEIMALCQDTAVVTSIDKTTSDLIEDQIIIYPNPAQGVINFKNITLGDKLVYIYDLQGKLINTHQLKAQLEIGYLENGLYLITVADEKTGKISIHKVSVLK